MAATAISSAANGSSSASGHVDPVHDRDEQERRGGAQLHQRVADRDRSLTVAAAPAQDEPRDDRHVVVGPDGVAAARAVRARGDDRLLRRHAVDHDVQERADHGAEHAETKGGTTATHVREQRPERGAARAELSSRCRAGWPAAGYVRAALLVAAHAVDRRDAGDQRAEVRRRRGRRGVVAHRHRVGRDPADDPGVVLDRDRGGRTIDRQRHPGRRVVVAQVDRAVPGGEELDRGVGEGGKRAEKRHVQAEVHQRGTDRRVVVQREARTPPQFAGVSTNTAPGHSTPAINGAVKRSVPLPDTFTEQTEWTFPDMPRLPVRTFSRRVVGFQIDVEQLTHSRLSSPPGVLHALPSTPRPRHRDRGQVSGCSAGRRASGDVARPAYGALGPGVALP